MTLLNSKNNCIFALLSLFNVLDDPVNHSIVVAFLFTKFSAS
jgi:hypothetical protein